MGKRLVGSAFFLTCCILFAYFLIITAGDISELSDLLFLVIEFIGTLVSGIYSIVLFCLAISFHRKKKQEENEVSARKFEESKTSSASVQYQSKISIANSRGTTSTVTCEARPKSIRTLSDMKRLNDFVVIDTETTGLSRQSDSIVEIAMIKFENGVEVDRFSTLINPERPIPAEASRVNGIFDSDVVSAPRILEVAGHISEFIGSKFIVGHNVSFDLAFLLRECGDAFSQDVVYYIDTIGLAKRAFPNLPNYKLETLISELNIAKTQNHRAEADAEYTSELMKLCLSQLIHDDEEKDRIKKEMISLQLEKCQNSPIYKKKFVFDFDTDISRSDAEEALLEVGGLYRTAVSGQTDYLVVKNSNVIENKFIKEKISAIEAKGHKVEIISVSQFFELLRDAKTKMNSLEK